jgi:DNA (cytosine-5)-methyltransferase 1
VADGAPRLQRITDYPALLAGAWAEAHAPREPNAPTVISTFAGCGGSSLGYHMADFRELLAVEWEQNAADTFRLNFPDVPLYHGDIAKLSVEECLRRAGIAPGELDVFDGSPPCQGFSTSGKREMGDQRNQLFREFVRLLTGLRPRAFVMENVSGMVKGDFKLIFAEILRTLKGCGYRVKVRLLNAMFFGVPQARERMIFIGVRDDLGIEPSHPSGWSEPTTPRTAFVDVDTVDSKPLAPWLLKAAAEMDAGNYSRDHVMRAFIKHKGTPGSSMSTKLLSWDRPSCTIMKQEIGASGIIHPNRARYLSTGELRRIGSFPDAFRFTDRKNAVERIGNSVPPLLMRSIARHVRTLVARG